MCLVLETWALEAQVVTVEGLAFRSAKREWWTQKAPETFLCPGQHVSTQPVREKANGSAFTLPTCFSFYLSPESFATFRLVLRQEARQPACVCLVLRLTGEG